MPTPTTPPPPATPDVDAEYWKMQYAHMDDMHTKAEGDLIEVYNALWPEHPHDWVPGEATGFGPRMVEQINELKAHVRRLEAEVAAARAEAAGMRGVVDRLPRTADGVPITPGMTLYLECPDPSYWRQEPGTIVAVVADSITVGLGFREYAGTHTICGEDIECGNLDCYSTPEAARRALAAAAPGGALPTLDDIHAMNPTIPGGMTPEEYIDDLRGEEDDAAAAPGGDGESL